MASKYRSRKKSNPIAIATDRTAMPYRRNVGMGVGDEGSRCAMACLIREPADQRGAMRESWGRHEGINTEYQCQTYPIRGPSYSWSGDCTSGFGTFETCRRTLKMSACRGI